MGYRCSGSMWARVASSLVVWGIAAGAARAQETLASADSGTVESPMESATSVRLIVEGSVLDPRGAPAVGVVVVTSAGGQAVVDENGSYRIEVQVPLGAESLQVTAIGSEEGSLAASTNVGIIPVSGRATVRILTLARRARCDPEWLPTFGGLPGTSGVINASAVYDDGDGPALYLAGAFNTAGGVRANGVAKWDGSSWSAVGSGLTLLPGGVRALAVFDDGGGPKLYAGGAQVAAGGGVAAWDGSAWAPLGSGVNGWVSALAVYDDGSGPALYAGGFFTTAGGVPANRIAKWDGSSWSALGSGMADNFPFTPEVRALAVYDDGSGPTLYAGGVFTTAGGVSANRIARWDGSSWTALGSGMSGPNSDVVSALATYDDGIGAALYAGGRFHLVPESGDSFLAKWGVLDTAAPVIDCPGGLTVRGGPATPVRYSVGASDDCDPAPELVCIPPSGSVFGWGTTTVTCTATDAAGNTALCIFDVTERPRPQVHAGPPQTGPASPAPPER